MLRRIFFAIALMVPTIVFAQPPVVPGHARFYAQADPSVEAGLLLLGELNCISCHKPVESLSSAVSLKKAPILDSVGSRIRSGYMVSFLENPKTAKPGSSMPDVLAGMDAGKTVSYTHLKLPTKA